MNNLRSVPTQVLLQELLGRSDLINKDGLTVYGEGYQLITKMTPIPCTDGVPVRLRKNGVVEAGLIVRGTGLYKGTYTMIGGRIVYGRTIENALKAHFQTDLGVELTMLSDWSRPDYVFQYFPEKIDGLGHDPSKHAIALTYLVTLQDTPVTLGKTAHGGQEALGLHWFSYENRPAENKFGHNHNIPWTACLLKVMRDPHLKQLLPVV